MSLESMNSENSLESMESTDSENSEESMALGGAGTSEIRHFLVDRWLMAPMVSGP